MVVKVTREDIDLGTPSSSTNCPIACALKRMGYRNITVGRTGAWFEGNHYNLPHEAQNFIDDFDKCYIVVPMEFILCLSK